MTEWIISCNIKKFDIDGAFSSMNKLDYKQSTNIEVGDIVYIYVGAPIQALRYRCLVHKVNLPECEIDDTNYVIDGAIFESYGRYMELEMLEKYNCSKLKYKELKANGLGNVQGPSKVKKQLSRYIQLVRNDIEKKIKKKVEETADIDFINELNDEITHVKSGFVYKGVQGTKKNLISQNGRLVYPRDRKTSLNALAHANYKCEIDANHPSFIRASIEENYTEPHHLVPLYEADKFEVSLDVEENIVSLCSNCHNEIHYGKDAKKLLIKLYNQRKDLLKSVGINVSLTELLNMYCISI